MIKPLIAAAAMSAALATAPAIAGDAKGKSVAVSYADLDLSSEAGQKVLQRRLESAARRACDYDSTRTGSRIKSQSKRQCLSVARRSAQTQFAQIVSEQQLGG